jgi:hypothetical protein
MPRYQRRPLSPPGCLRIRLRILPSLSWRNIGACRPPGWRNRRVVARISGFDAYIRTPLAKLVDLLAKPRAAGRCEARVVVLTERRRRCVHPAPILRYSGPAMRLGRPVVVWAGQIAPTPRIRPREVARRGGSEAHGASNSRPSDLKLALVAYWYGLALGAGSSRHIWHIADGKRASGCSHVTLSTGRPPSTERPMPAYSRRLVSLQVARSICIRDGRVPLAAAGLRLERRLRWQVRALTW